VQPTDGRIELDIVVDAASIEVFAGGGDAALTMATFGTEGGRGVLLEGARGEVVVSDASLTPLRVAPIARTTRGG
jgi:levanbiose-producing levanase